MKSMNNIPNSFKVLPAVIPNRSDYRLSRRRKGGQLQFAFLTRVFVNKLGQAVLLNNILKRVV